MPRRRSQARFAREEHALSAIARPGRCRGLPRPRRDADGPSAEIGSHVLAQLVSRRRRQRRSAAIWILVVSPPRDRPIASRPDFLSFAKPPARSSPAHTAAPRAPQARAPSIRADRPVLALGLIAPARNPSRISPRSHPATSGDAGHRQSSSSPALRQSRHGHPPGPGVHPVHHHPVRPPAATLLRTHWQEHPQPLSFLTDRSWRFSRSSIVLIYTVPVDLGAAAGSGEGFFTQCRAPARLVLEEQVSIRAALMMSTPGRHEGDGVKPT